MRGARSGARSGAAVTEAVILIGIQATGKSTFFQSRFADTHVRINLDMLRTRPRERHLIKACLETGQSFVVDNTNPSREDRARYIDPARAAGFRIIGYYFSSTMRDAMARNAGREGKARIPDKGIRGTRARLELPSPSEGFDELFFVRITGPGEFTVDAWREGD